MTREQLLALIRDAQEFIDHSATCDEVANWSALPPYPVCDCGMRLLMVRVEDALATERTETNDGDDDGN